MAQALEGLHVLDLTRVLAGPYATMILADLGADVIKLEMPISGDDARAFPPHINGESAYFMSANNVKWRKPVRPGDQLIIEVEMKKGRSKIGKAKGVCKVQDEVVSEAEVTFIIRES